MSVFAPSVASFWCQIEGSGIDAEQHLTGSNKQLAQLTDHIVVRYLASQHISSARRENPEIR